MADSPGFVDLVKELRSLLDAEYQRGFDDASRRIIAAARAEVSPPKGRSDSGSGTPLVLAEAAKSASRAPRGAADNLIDRVLGASFPNGASSKEIHAAARSGVEKMVSLGGIRFALDRGKGDGKLRNADGKWFLTRETKN